MEVEKMGKKGKVEVVEVAKVRNDLVERFSQSEIIRLAENEIMKRSMSIQLKELRTRFYENADQTLINQLKELNTKIAKLTFSDAKNKEKKLMRLREERDKITKELSEKYPKIHNKMSELKTSIRVYNRDSDKLVKSKLIEKLLEEIDNWDIEDEFKTLVKQ